MGVCLCIGHPTPFCTVSWCDYSRNMCICKWLFLGSYQGRIQGGDQQDDTRVVDSADYRDAHRGLDFQWYCPGADVFWI